MLLVDTSIWVDFIGKSPTPARAYVVRQLESHRDVVICPQIIQEVLQGSKSENEFIRLRDYFLDTECLAPENLVMLHVRSANLYARCRWQGVTIRSVIDCVIAQYAIEHNAVLLHNDRDYLHIAHVEPKLKHHHFLTEVQ